MNLTLTKKILFLATFITTLVYLLWRTFFTIPVDYGVLALFFGILLLLCEMVAGFESLEQYLNMSYGFEPEMPVIPEDWYPDVDILIMTHNEDRHLIYKTANACRYLRYPDPGRVHVYICDDKNRPEMRALAAELDVGYFGLADNKHAKAGNMNNALGKTHSPLIATFDADMIPRSNFLMETVPYFFLPQFKQNGRGEWEKREPEEIDPDYKIGFIQIPQAFYNLDLFQYNLYSESRFPNEQDFFTREINIGRNRSNSALFLGSNAVFSRRALNDAGGIAINTITEDFETGIRIQAQGYTTYALSKPLAHGLSPNSISGLISQRERWGRGCIQSLKNTRFLVNKGLSLGQKTSYLSTAVYWWTFARRFVYIITPIIAVLFHMVVVETTFWQLLAFWLPFYILTNYSLKYLSGNTRNQHWNNLIDTILFPYIIIPVILEYIGIRKRQFVVTRKDNQARLGTSPFFMALPHLFMFGASVLAVLVCLMQIIETAALYNIIIIFWLILNTKNLFFAVCFMLGRVNYRQTDRFFIQLPVDIAYAAGRSAGISYDISEGGVSVIFDVEPKLLQDDEEVKISLATEKYAAEIYGVLRHTHKPRRKGQAWRLSFQVTRVSEENRSQFYQILYDRVPPLVRQIPARMTLYDDFRDNIRNRLEQSYKWAMRKYPRAYLGLSVVSDTGRRVLLTDFAYKFVFVKSSDADIRDAMKLELTPEVFLDLKRIGNYKGSKRRGHLYQVQNLEELLDNKAFAEFMSEMKIPALAA